MNDYFAGELTRQRHADFLRETMKGERAAEARRLKAEAGQPAPAAPGVVAPVAGRPTWRRLVGHLVPRRLVADGHRP